MIIFCLFCTKHNARTTTITPRRLASRHMGLEYLELYWGILGQALVRLEIIKGGQKWMKQHDWK